MLNRLKAVRLGFLVTLAFAMFSLFLLAEGVSLGVGSLSVPEPGFFPFVSGALLCGLTSVQLMFHSRTDASAEEEGEDSKQSLVKLVLFVSTLFLYCIILNLAGFLVSTFLLSAILLFIMSAIKWYKVAVVSAICSVLSFVLFKILLGLPLPSGYLS